MSPEQAESTPIRTSIPAATSTRWACFSTNCWPAERLFELAGFELGRNVPHDSRTGSGSPVRADERPPKEERTAIARRRGARRLSCPPREGDLDWIVMKCLDKERGRRYRRPMAWPPISKGICTTTPLSHGRQPPFTNSRRAWRREQGLLCHLPDRGNCIGRWGRRHVNWTFSHRICPGPPAGPKPLLQPERWPSGTHRRNSQSEAGQRVAARPARLATPQLGMASPATPSHREPLVLPGTNQVNALSFNSDGTLLASGGVDRDVGLGCRLWENGSTACSSRAR